MKKIKKLFVINALTQSAFNLIQFPVKCKLHTKTSKAKWIRWVYYVHERRPWGDQQIAIN